MMLPEGDNINDQTDQAQIGGVPAAVVGELYMWVVGNQTHWAV